MSQQPPNANTPNPPGHWEALARYLAGESSPEEAAAMRRWLAEDPARLELAGQLNASFERIAFQAPAGLDVEAALKRVKAHRAAATVPTREYRFPALRPPVLRWAASILLLLGATFVWWTVRAGPEHPAPASALTYTTPVGQTDSVNLPDGSRVVLGPASTLTVAATYNAEDRVVQLQGEAYFDVVHDDARPFSVETGRAIIRDLGTRFAVRSHNGQPVDVVVTEGSVLLRAAAAQSDSGIVLRAGDRAELGAGRPAVLQRGSASEADLAWTRGRLVFEDAPLSRVSTDLRRWYGIELRTTDTTFAGRHITATFDGDPVDQVLNVIALALGADIQRRGDTAFVRLRENPR